MPELNAREISVLELLASGGVQNPPPLISGVLKGLQTRGLAFSHGNSSWHLTPKGRLELAHWRAYNKSKPDE